MDNTRPVTVTLVEINKDLHVTNFELEIDFDKWNLDLKADFYSLYFKSFLEALYAIPDKRLYDWFKKSCGL